MCKKLLLLISLVLVLCLVSSSSATTFYVNPVNGSMENDCSEESPWETLQGVFDNNKIETKDKNGNPKNSGAPVKARDKSSNLNETAYSTSQSATTQDGTAPSPDPMTWSTEPYATGTSSISMTATTATDSSGVEYYFDFTAPSRLDSGWQNITIYSNTGLSANTHNYYKLKARVNNSNQNDTTYYWAIDEINDTNVWPGNIWSFTTAGVAAPGQASNPSPADCATDVSVDADLSWTADTGADSHDVYFSTISPGTFQDDQIATTFDPDPMTWATEPYATGTTSISMTATTATDSSGVEYYFDCTAGGGRDSGWQDSTTYEDTGLSASTQYTYRVKARDKSSNQNETAYSTTNTDAGGVEYYFDFTAPSRLDSGWQDSTTYTDKGLSELTGYTYRRERSSSWQDSTIYSDTGLSANTHTYYKLKARVKNSNQNETSYYTAKSAITRHGTAPSPDPMTWATDPYATGTSFILMTATTATDASGAEYYFDFTAPSRLDSGWQDSATYEDTGIKDIDGIQTDDNNSNQLMRRKYDVGNKKLKFCFVKQRTSPLTQVT